MTRFWGTLAAIVILLVLFGAYLISVTPFRADQEAAVRDLVEAFGEKLEDVSLLGSKESVADAIDAAYSPYVAAELLMQWMNDPESAPGRLTSSPWPDRIEIRSTTKQSDTRYGVEGEIVEVTNEGGGIDESPTEAVRRPVSIVAEKTDIWRITSFEMGPYPGDGEWTLSEPDARGLQFMYPATLPTQYISAQDWPPAVMLEGGEYSCAEEEQKMVGDREYCVTTTSEGAAGSTYRSYIYATAQGDFIARAAFTLRFPQCMNYDEPQRGACTAEQESFDIDGLADRIISSIRMQ